MCGIWLCDLIEMVSLGLRIVTIEDSRLLFKDISL